MTDLISRQAAVELLYKRLIESANNNVGYVTDAGIVFEDIATERIERWLNELPTIEPFSTSGYVTTSTDEPPVVYAEQKRGTWKKAERDGCVTYSDAYLQCSECGKAIFLAKTMNFCPHCGAKMIMRGENEN